MSLAENVSQLSDNLGYWHNRLNRLVETGFERRLTAFGLTVSQWSVMALLFHGEARTIGELADAFPLDQGAVSRLVDRLREKSLVVRRRHETDRRLTIVELTEKGRALMPELAAAADDNDASFFGVLDDDEIAEYRQLLAKLLMHAARAVTDQPDRDTR